MNELDRISDDELKQRLEQYGISTPVTVSTRNILIKKLTKLISQSKPPRKHAKLVSGGGNGKKYILEAASLNSFSSDEDEPPVPSARLRRSPRNGVGHEDFTNFRGHQRKPAFSRRTSQTLDTEKSYTPLALNSHGSNPMMQEESDSYSDSDLDRSSEFQEDKMSEPFEDPCGSKFYKNFKIFDTEQDKRHLPVVSSVRKSEQRGTETCVFHAQPTNVMKLRSPEDIISQERIPLQPQSDTDYTDRSGDDRNGSLLQLVPVLLLCTLTVFFISIGAVYLNIPKSGLREELAGNNSEESPIGLFTEFDARNKFPMCEGNIQNDCLTQFEMSELPALLAVMDEVIKPLLATQAVSYECGTSAHYYISLEEAQHQLLKALPSISTEAMKEGVRGIGKLVALNGHWGLEAVWLQVHAYPQNSDLLGLALAHRPRQYLCHVKRILAYSLLIGSSVASGFAFLWFAYKYVKKQKQQTAADMQTTENEAWKLVSEILEVLERSSEMEVQEYVPVNYVRDFLIPPRERESKKHIWQKAIDLLHRNENRLRHEVRLVDGEETDVWRWKEGALRSPVSSSYRISKSSVEMTPAKASFEKADVQTSCLKMLTKFESHIKEREDWPAKVREDIVERCSPAKLVHVAVDKGAPEGWIYCKCRSPDDAKIAYAALHCSSYNGNLVYAKYVDEDRYHKHFPSAINLRTPLHNGRRSSRRAFTSS